MFAVVLMVGLGLAGMAAAAAPAPTRPFVATAIALGMTGVGDGASTPTGDHLRCRSGRHYAQNLTLRNRSRVPVTLIGAGLDRSSARIVQRVAVQIRLAPRPLNSEVEVPGLRNWSRSAATPVTIPPGRSAWVQSDFLIHNCTLLVGDRKLIANRAMTLLFEVSGKLTSQQLAVPSARIILIR